MKSLKYIAKYTFGLRLYNLLALYKKRLIEVKFLNIKSSCNTVEAIFDAPFRRVMLICYQNGIYLYDGEVVCLIKGYNFRCVVKFGDRWYAAQNASPWFIGQIISFRIKGREISDLRKELYLVRACVHKMLVFEDVLYVVDPGFAPNRIRVLKKGRNKLTTIRHVVFSDPPGLPLEIQDYSEIINEPYNQHINSICQHKGNFYIGVHNRYRRTKRKSEYIKTDGELNILERRFVEGKEIHDLSVFKGELAFCSSLESIVVIGGRRFQYDEMEGLFLRGLDIREREVLVGGTEKKPRAERNSASAHVFVFDQLEDILLFQLTIPEAGAVYDVHFID